MRTQRERKGPTTEEKRRVLEALHYVLKSAIKRFLALRTQDMFDRGDFNTYLEARMSMKKQPVIPWCQSLSLSLFARQCSATETSKRHWLWRTCNTVREQFTLNKNDFILNAKWSFFTLLGIYEPFSILSLFTLIEKKVQLERAKV